jgi:hypothetical protein
MSEPAQAELAWCVRSGRWAGTHFILVICGFVWGCPSVGPVMPGGGNGEAPQAVLLLGVEGLELSITGDRNVYKLNPASFQPLGAGTDERFAGFFLSVATADPDALKAAITNRRSGIRAALQRLAPPVTADELRRAEDLEPYTAEAESILSGGGGLFWISGEASPSPPATKIGVLLPESVGVPLSVLEVYASEVGGRAVAGARIELTDRFFNMAVLGDSVAWGNGLRLYNKIWVRVAEFLEAQLERKVMIQRYAMSGAPVVPFDGEGLCAFPCNGELPAVLTSVTNQAGQIIEPTKIDLVVMNGCINDLGRGIILDRSEDIELLRALTVEACDEEMGGLLEQVREVTPNAVIVVMGYYPIIGVQSDLTGVLNLQLIEGTGLEGGGVQLADLAERSRVFADTANASLQNAVDRLNTNHPDAPPAAFADPGFGPANVIFGPEAWLWGLTDEAEGFEALNLGLDVFPEDPMRFNRLDLCLEFGLSASLVPCLYASIGHPNEEGAEAYVEAILAELERLRIFPLATLPVITFEN